MKLGPTETSDGIVTMVSNGTEDLTKLPTGLLISFFTAAVGQFRLLETNIMNQVPPCSMECGPTVIVGRLVNQLSRQITDMMTEIEKRAPTDGKIPVQGMREVYEDCKKGGHFVRDKKQNEEEGTKEIFKEGKDEIHDRRWKVKSSIGF